MFTSFVCFQNIYDNEVDGEDLLADSATRNDTSNIVSKTASCLSVTIEQVSYSMPPASRSISPTHNPSSCESNNRNHEKHLESCLTTTTCSDTSSRTSTNPTVSFGSTTGFWQKAPFVHLKLDYPDSQNFKTTVADTNRREIDEQGEETQSFAWANPQQFKL